MAEIEAIKPYLVPELAVWPSAEDVLVAGRADALAVKGERVEAVIDWKSDVDVTPTVRAGYVHQLQRYLSATGASRGALVFMSLGEIVWVGQACGHAHPRRRQELSGPEQGVAAVACHDVVYRHALALDETGERLAFGSTTGGLWVSEDQGDSWAYVTHTLPPIYAVRFTVTHEAPDAQYSAGKYDLSPVATRRLSLLQGNLERDDRLDQGVSAIRFATARSSSAA